MKKGGKAANGGPKIIGRCMKCKCQRQVINPKKQMIGKDKDRPAVKGECPECQCTIFRIIGKEEAEKIFKQIKEG